MPLPKTTTSKTTKNKPPTHFKISLPPITQSPNSPQYKLSHPLSKNSRSYNPEQVLSK
ncbi:50S ribosomal protein L32 [Staphylococcus epidermidis]|uniref:50S ribosomal protein L32 n=1 Tax=Staphylococcus epidermidis TaxID=1282 RepID=UPI0011A878B5|nr:50S ribosomal protein L32 [Staphylococcus epidermidis]